MGMESVIHSWLCKLSTVKGLYTRLSLVGPAKLAGHTYFISYFTVTFPLIVFY